LQGGKRKEARQMGSICLNAVPPLPPSCIPQSGTSPPPSPPTTSPPSWEVSLSTASHRAERAFSLKPFSPHLPRVIVHSRGESTQPSVIFAGLNELTARPLKFLPVLETSLGREDLLPEENLIRKSPSPARSLRPIWGSWGRGEGKKVGREARETFGQCAVEETLKGGEGEGGEPGNAPADGSHVAPQDEVRCSERGQHQRRQRASPSTPFQPGAALEGGL